MAVDHPHCFRLVLVGRDRSRSEVREIHNSFSGYCLPVLHEHCRRVPQTERALFAAIAAIVPLELDACVAEIRAPTSELVGAGTWPTHCTGFGHKARRARASDPLGSSPPLSLVYATTHLCSTRRSLTPSDSYA